jgi:transposase
MDFDAELGRDFHETLRGCQLGIGRSEFDRKGNHLGGDLVTTLGTTLDWTPERIKRQAGEIGRNTAALVEIIMRERAHPEQGFRACIGITRLVKSYGRERVEAACGRALEIGARSYTSVKSILKNNLDSKRAAAAVDGPVIEHSNIRGPGYFH